MCAIPEARLIRLVKRARVKGDLKKPPKTLSTRKTGDTSHAYASASNSYACNVPGLIDSILWAAIQLSQVAVTEYFAAAAAICEKLPKLVSRLRCTELACKLAHDRDILRGSVTES
jgi:hypothetical protein